MRFTFPDGQYRIFSSASIVRTLGLRNSGRHVSLLKIPPKQRQNIAEEIRSVLNIDTKAATRDGGLSIEAILEMFRGMNPLKLTRVQERAAEMGFSLLSASTYVAPKQSYQNLLGKSLHVCYVKAGQGFLTWQNGHLK